MDAKTSVRFTVDFDGFEWVGNVDHTRWFLVLKVSVAPNSEVRIAIAGWAWVSS
jgi:hypothetical protein